MLRSARKNGDSRASGQAGVSVGLLLTVDEWTAVWRAQGGKCLICEKPLRNRYDLNSKGQTGGADHDHQLESTLRKQGASRDEAVRRSIRGLICVYPCNRLLVRYWTPERLERAAVYCREMPAQALLRVHAARA